jgi:hypothetical protein
MDDDGPTVLAQDSSPVPLLPLAPGPQKQTNLLKIKFIGSRRRRALRGMDFVSDVLSPLTFQLEASDG